MAMCGAGSPVTWPPKERYCLEWDGVTCPKCLERKPKPVEKPVEKPAVFVSMNQDKREPCYEDVDPMPFGKHKGTMMQDVPASYLFWLWTQRPLGNKKVENYIHNNMLALKKEHPDGIWT